MNKTQTSTSHPSIKDTAELLAELLRGDLAFKGQATNYATHAVHAFAAKFPPQLPRTFVQALTKPGDVVLDPMAGSGTALVEAAILGRAAIGADIDPLALKITRAKCTPIDVEEALIYAEGIADWARSALEGRRLFRLKEMFEGRFGEEEKRFLAYWFAERTTWELCALLQGVDRVSPPHLRNFFEVVFSSTIVTKSGGVSLARDLAHSRPHLVAGKKVGNAIDVFSDKVGKAGIALSRLPAGMGPVIVLAADARALPLSDDSVDLIVTSPPYANAIDYVRAHKFSLIWLGHALKELSRSRRSYVGAEVGYSGRDIPSPTARKAIEAIGRLDMRRASIVARYFKEMEQALSEMSRILKPGKVAIVVVGSSTVRGVKVETAYGLAELAGNMGFKVVGVQERPLDRDRRLMPVSYRSNGNGIEARMHEEHVVGLLKAL